MTGAHPKETAMTQAIPPGMTAVTPHLVCRNAAAAIEFYKQAFGAVDDQVAVRHGAAIVGKTQNRRGCWSLRRRRNCQKTAKMAASPFTITGFCYQFSS